MTSQARALSLLDRAAGLARKIAGRKSPPRTLIYALLNKVAAHRNPHNRFVFERLYAEQPDPWEYRVSRYEQQKYATTLQRILQHRRGAESALEIGCSIGVFTKELARHFQEIVALDFAAEALTQAADYCGTHRNIRFIRSDFLSLKLRATFDVIACAEVLYYIPERHAPAVCRQLDRYVRRHGIIVMLEGSDQSPFWETALSSRFHPVLTELVPDESRPYKLIIFEKR